MNLKTILRVLVFIPLLVAAQNKRSKADDYFYSYQYRKAINAYKDQMLKDSLTNVQKLNLADSYLKTNKFTDAANLYLEVSKNDTIMSSHRFNKLLQSLSKGAEKDKVKEFLTTNASIFSAELIENARFNFRLLEADSEKQKIQTIGLMKNSPQDDFSPAFYKGNLLFSSAMIKESKGVYEPSGESYLDIYLGKLDASGNMTSVARFDKIPDTKFHQSTPYYSEKLNNFFYILSNTENGKMAFDDKGKNALAIAQLKENGQFNFVLRDLSASFYYPYFDDTTNKLYFAANLLDSFGGTDLYYVYTNNGQIMSAPVNLGPRINSPGNEISPFIFQGSLYFSSDVFYGLGGMDIYKSNLLQDNSFSIPVNIGEGINSEKDDFGFIIKGDEHAGYSGYYASNKAGGKGGDDLYMFEMDQLPGLKTFALKGAVVNYSSDGGIGNAEISVLNTDGDLVSQTFSNAEGSFRIELPWQKQVTVRIVKDGFSIFERSYSEDLMEQIQDELFMVSLAKLDDLLEVKEGKSVIKLSKFYFGKGSSEINNEVLEALNKVIEVVKKFPLVKLKIENHTDSRGSTKSNKNLSKERIKTITNYLLANGLTKANILEAMAYGEERIKNGCKNGAYCLDFLHNQNNRTLFVVEE